MYEIILGWGTECICFRMLMEFGLRLTKSMDNGTLLCIHFYDLLRWFLVVRKTHNLGHSTEHNSCHVLMDFD